MTFPWVLRTRRALIVTTLAVFPAAALAQYAEAPRTLGVVNGYFRAGTQIGRRLFVTGSFSRVSPPTGSAVVVDPQGTHIPGVFPRFDGPVTAIVADGLGGWLVAGGFTRVAGQSQAGFARVRPDRTIDPRYRLTADGPLNRVVVAHGRIYFIGSFTRVNGATRRGLAALDAATGTLSPFAASFDPGGRALAALSISSIGVYVAGWVGGSGGGRLWGFDAANGQQLFERNALVNAIAATSARVYVGGFGYQRPVWAVDPLSGQDLPWSAGLTFQPRTGTYGDYTSIGALLLDEGRLYLAGYFGTNRNPPNLAAMVAESGQPVSWPSDAGPSFGRGLIRIGPAVVAIGEFTRAYAVTTGTPQNWHPAPYGAIQTAAAVPEGVVIGGMFNGIGGEERYNLAAFDLDTGALEPWTAAVPLSVEFEDLETDGTFLFGVTQRGAFYKIDPTGGAVLGTVDFGSQVYWVRHRVAGGRIIVAADNASGVPELAIITIADWSRQSVPVTFGGSLSKAIFGIEVTGSTAYLAGTFTSVNGVDRPNLAAVDLDTGAVLPFAPSPDAFARSVRFWNGAIVAGGSFRRIGGARRRGLAALDPVTGRALDWNPDAPGGAWADVGPDGLLYVVPDAAIGGRSLPNRLVAFSPATSRLLPWRPQLPDVFLLFDRLSFSADCLVVGGSSDVNCHAPALPSPSAPQVLQSGNQVAMQWTLPPGSPTWAAVRVEAGSREGASDLGTFDLPADATSLGDAVGAGSYFARVRTTGPGSASMATDDVSFAVGGPAPPLDAAATTEGTTLTFTWRPPSTGPTGAYVIEAGTAEGRADLAQLFAAGSATSLWLVDVPPGRYWGRIRTLGDHGLSVPSGELILDVDATRSPCNGPPAAPLMLSASTGLAVELRWTQPDSGSVADLQHIVAGSAPGLADLATIEVPGAATSFTTSRPPRGIYYVRVQGMNTCGVGAFSNEVQVIIQ